MLYIRPIVYSKQRYRSQLYVGYLSSFVHSCGRPTRWNALQSVLIDSSMDLLSINNSAVSNTMAVSLRHITNRLKPGFCGVAR